MGRTAAGPTNANPFFVEGKSIKVTRMSDLNSAAGSALSLEIETQTKVYGTTDNASSRPTGSPSRTPRFGSRHTFALMAFLGLATSYMMRINLSVAIVAMVRTPSSPETITNSTFPPQAPHFCPARPLQSYKPKLNGEFDWDSHTQGLILGSFFWGYTVTQIPGGLMASKLGGGKYVFGLGILFSGVFSLAIPMAARFSTYAMIILRILTGFGEGVTLPAVHHLLSDWVPVQERSTIGAFVLAGMQFGTVVALPVSGFLCEINWDGGWPLAFYVPGFLAIIWFFAWCYLGSNNPQVHPTISDEEREYITMSIGDRQRDHEIPTPWSEIVRSIPVWAILIAHIGKAWGFSVLLTELPTYMKTVLHFDIKANSILSALPYLAMWMFSMVFSVIADSLGRKGTMSTTDIRKLFNTIGFMAPASAFIAVSFTGCNETATITLLTLATGFIGAVYSGFEVNHIDIAPAHAGILMGVTNCVASMCGFLAPYAVGLTVTSPGAVDQWQIVFLISASIYVVTNLIYVLFASAEEQPWNSIWDSGKRK